MIRTTTARLVSRERGGGFGVKEVLQPHGRTRFSSYEERLDGIAGGWLLVPNLAAANLVSQGALWIHAQENASPFIGLRSLPDPSVFFGCCFFGGAFFSVAGLGNTETVLQS